MYAPHDNTTPSTHSPTSNLVSIWARGRRQITPWAYPRLRVLAAVRCAVGIFLAGLGVLMLSSGHYGWAALPLAFAALHFAIASLDITVARSASLRT
jgi:fatty acid desaturase